MNASRMLVLISAYLAIVQTSFANISASPPTIESRFEQSDFVWAGIIESVTDISEANPNGDAVKKAELRVMVHVQRDYKGGTAGDRTILIESVGSGGHNGMTGKHILFFVNQPSPGDFHLAKLSGSMLPFTLSTKIQPSGYGAQALQADLRTELASPGSDEEHEEQLRTLSQFRSIDPTTESVLNGLSAAQSPVISTLCITILAKATPHKKLYARNLIAQLAANPERTELKTEDIFDIVTSNTDPENLPSLKTLAGTSTASPIRLAAMNSIRTMQLPESESFLVGMLDSADQTMQYEAIISLAEITKTYGDYAPSLGAFNKNPKLYVERWKAWAIEHGIRS